MFGHGLGLNIDRPGAAGRAGPQAAPGGDAGAVGAGAGTAAAAGGVAQPGACGQPDPPPRRRAGGYDAEPSAGTERGSHGPWRCRFASAPRHAAVLGSGGVVDIPEDITLVLHLNVKLTRYLHFHIYRQITTYFCIKLIKYFKF